MGYLQRSNFTLVGYVLEQIKCIEIAVNIQSIEIAVNIQSTEIAVNIPDSNRNLLQRKIGTLPQEHQFL